jgi:hypothetical protein
MTFALYNASEQDFKITLDVKYKTQKLYKSMPEVTLIRKQITYVEIPLLNVDWEKTKGIDHIRFMFDDLDGVEGQQKTLYVKGIMIFDK